jgi:hypothetical protein
MVCGAMQDGISVLAKNGAEKMKLAHSAEHEPDLDKSDLDAGWRRDFLRATRTVRHVNAQALEARRRRLSARIVNGDIAFECGVHVSLLERLNAGQRTSQMAIRHSNRYLRRRNPGASFRPTSTIDAVFAATDRLNAHPNEPAERGTFRKLTEFPFLRS